MPGEHLDMVASRVLDEGSLAVAESELERTQSAVVPSRTTRTRGGARGSPMSGAVDTEERKNLENARRERMSTGPTITTVKPVVQHGKSVATATASKETVRAAHHGEIGRRLQQAGAVVGAITCSLVWDNTDDLDLHCTGPTGSHIHWNDKKGKCGGHLDVDMNASDKHCTSCAVENIFWEHPPNGRYRLWVENNTSRDDGPTPFSVRLTKGGESQDKKFEDIEEYESV